MAVSATKGIQTVGRRKTAIARIKLLPGGSGKVTVNGKEAAQYFPVARMHSLALQPLQLTGETEKVDLQILCHGGGVSAQADAVRMGVARALLKLNNNYHDALKKGDMFTRDPRMVERKKYGLRKARRGTQFSKR